MSIFDLTIERVEAQLKGARRSKNIFFCVIVLLALSMTLIGIIFAGYVLLLVQEMRAASYMLMQVEIKSGSSSATPMATPEKLANIIGENTIWVPTFAGVVVALLVVVYLFRIYVKRVIESENLLVRLDLYKAVESGDQISEALANSVLAFNLGCGKVEMPAMVPSMELAEKSLNSFDNIVSRSSSISSRFRRRT
ncbi:hypothetical protein [Aeromonas hydrophila]|uniref:hypothetical protein n=1 Tax=Aeromonas hydrophila TaxID=644 RepID=UPI002365C0A6|nr:hypothetical protein [Aeromonas hydrophila]WDF91901.1 hypothetical protein PUB83_06470 [Aeromonas hydrophila subsp. hydrophila]